MRSFNETLIRWEFTFAENNSISDLREAVKAPEGQNPCLNGLRSICWKAFLLFENLDKSTWRKTLLDSRSAYRSLKEHFLRDIEHTDDLASTDPLTGDESSPWNILRHDEELRAEIFQDVERCMPDNLYFREPKTQSMLLDILFVYCKLNRDIGYRQGMHEVLAPILWVVSRDAIDPEGLGQDSENHLDLAGLILEIFSEQNVEHDAFTLFGIIMQTVKTFYEMGSPEQPATSTGPNNSPIVERSKRIHEIYLRQADPELAEHLTTIEVLPQIFLIRWIRLLFGREFPFDDVLSLWDHLFAEDPTLDVVDLICVSMLLRIRWQLIEADYSAALTLLLRYPAPLFPQGPPTLVGDALYLRGNILMDGGTHIILKYSKRLPGSQSVKTKKGRRRRGRKQNDRSDLNSLRISPTKFLQEQGGIEGILQEAARGVYSRGEKWGVTKALRGAVQGLQSANSSSRGNGLHWVLDQDKFNAGDDSHAMTRLQELEQRNKALAKLLEKAMEDLWAQQNEFTKDKRTENAADAISLAIAKVQFVQVYLENPTMPFPTETSAEEIPEKAKQEISSGSMTKNGSKEAEAALLSVASSDPFIDSEIGESQQEATIGSSQVSQPTDPTSSVNHPIDDPTDPIPQLIVPKNRQDRVSFQQPRPSLAHSSFSWMLGEDQRKSSFVSAIPFPSERRIAARGKTGFLFGDGDDKVEGSTKKSHSLSKVKEQEKDKEVISLGLLSSEGGVSDLN